MASCKEVFELGGPVILEEPSVPERNARSRSLTDKPKAGKKHVGHGDKDAGRVCRSRIVTVYSPRCRKG